MSKYFLLFILLFGGSFAGFAQEEKKQEEVYRSVEQMPEYPGGRTAMSKFIGKNLRYPETPRELGIEGTLQVEFIIKEDGIVDSESIKVSNSPHPDLSDEAIRVVRKMPQWKPGKQNGKPAKVFYTIPIIFHYQ